MPDFMPRCRKITFLESNPHRIRLSDVNLPFNLQKSTSLEYMSKSPSVCIGGEAD